MKDLGVYIKESCINEKLKLGDIKKDTLEGNWIKDNWEDPKVLRSIYLLRPGNVVNTDYGWWLVVRTEFAEKILPTMPHISYPIVMILQSSLNDEYEFLDLSDYDMYYPEDRFHTPMFFIKGINLRRKKYSNVKEVKEDLRSIYNYTHRA